MYIWLINHYAVPPEYYPLARQTYFAKNLMSLGHQVTIISASSVHNSDMNLITDGSKWKRETVDGVDHVYIKCCDYEGNGAKRVYNMLEFARKLPGVCRHLEKPDAIVATSMPPWSCAKGIKLSKKYGVPGVAEIADLWPESIVAYGVAKASNPVIKHLRKLEKWIYMNAESIVFTMEGAYEYIINQGWTQEVPEEKVFYINNGVDEELFESNRERYQLDDPDLNDLDTFKVVYTGSIRKANGIDMLLDAAKNIDNGRIKILVWGKGEELDGLKKRKEEEEISNIEFKGAVDKKEIPYILSKGDALFLDPFDEEIAKYGISSNKLFEYFAAGKPIISNSRSPYNPAEKRGCNVYYDTTAAGISQAIREIYDLDEEDYQDLCRKAANAAHDYSFRSLTLQLLGIIEGLRKARKK